MKREKNIMPKKVSEPIGTRISKAVYSAKRISERIVGYIPYELSFVCASYTGRTLRPAKITPIEKGIVGILLVDETSSFEKMGLILGLDVVNDRAEQALLRRAVDTLRSFHAIEGDDSCLALNEVGRAYAEKGERPGTYTKEFELFIDQCHPSWRNIKNCIGDSAKNIERINTPCDPIGLDLEEIKLYAEQQAQDVHFPQNRYLLEIASWNEGHKAKYNVYVCFVQNIATNEVRTFVYDEHTEALNSLMSEYINTDSALVSELLENCIKLECANDDATTILEAEEVEAAKAEIPVEIIEAEKQLVKDEEDQAESEMAVEPLDEKTVQTSNQISRVPEKDRLHKKALYDSMSFEVELQKIFTADDPDEIWLISPWIRKTAFINERGPMIENFLKDDSKRVFVAYSEPAANNDGKPMVDEEVEPGIKALEEQYPNFFYVQLPEFHLKNVIEVKGEQKVLFSGSFNVLSFSVSERQTHVRREEMALAHHTVARKKYDDCQLEFAQIYAQRIRKEVEGLNAKDIAGYKNEKMEYFLSLDNPEIRLIFSSIEDYIEEKTMQLIQEQVSKSLAELNQRLIVALNLGGVNQKDKKNFIDELRTVKKIIEENAIDDPSVVEDLENNCTLLEKIPVTRIFPDKDAGLKRIGRRDLNGTKGITQSTVATTSFTGVYSKTYNYVRVDDKHYPYPVRSKNDDLYDGAEVIFEVGSEPNKKNPDKLFYVAKDVRLK